MACLSFGSNGSEPHALSPTDPIAKRDIIGWSGRLDLNQRPLAPEASALPGCATPRRQTFHPCCPTNLTNVQLPRSVQMTFAPFFVPFFRTCFWIWPTGITRRPSSPS